MARPLAVPARPARATAAPAHRGQLARILERFRRHRLALAGTAALAVLALAAILAPYTAPYAPDLQDLDARLAPPTLAHPFGTDDLGRDMLSRVMHGARVSLAVGVLAMGVALGVGVLVGALAGYVGGRLDNALMRLVDVALSFPDLLILILLAMFFGKSLATVVLVIAALRWMTVARLVRASFLSLREEEFVLAARAIGASPLRIATRHMLVNALAPVIVAATLGTATAIIAESTLSYLGFGIQPPTASWGSMLRTAQDQLFTAPWTAIYPGLAIFVTVLSLNFVGDGLRDALDPTG